MMIRWLHLEAGTNPQRETTNAISLLTPKHGDEQVWTRTGVTQAPSHSLQILDCHRLENVSHTWNETHPVFRFGILM